MYTRKPIKKICFLIVCCQLILIGMAAQDFSWEGGLKKSLLNMADSLIQNLRPWEVPNRTFLVEDFGAVSNTTALNTVAIQQAINSCAAEGGGVVLLSKGDYITGTIELKSGVMLEIAEGSRILGSTDITDYPEKIEDYKSIMSEYYEFRQSLIYAEKCTNVGIRGKGEIYFRGEKENFSSPQTTGKIVGRPLGIRMVECKNIVLQDILLHNAASWMQNYVYCENLIFDGIKVVNHANYNNDGLDPDGCRNVIVRNCFINSEDDAMCLKGGSGKPSQNILIENSTFISTCNAFKIGTDTQGAFKNIVIRNVVLGGIPDTLPSISGHQASTGITLATVDGGDVENIYIKDVIINQARCPIFLRIGNRFRLLPEWENPGAGDLRRVVIENVTGDRNFRQGSFISGIQNKKIDDILIRNVNLTMEGITEPVFAGLPVDENEGGYPDAHQFSVDGLPAYGFFIRHAENILLEDVNIKPVPDDARPCFISGGNVQNIFANGEAVKAQALIDFTYTPEYIKNVEIIGHGDKATVLKYRLGTRIFNDRSTVVVKTDSLFSHAEYIQWPANLRTSTADTLLVFEVSAAGTLYIAYDPVYSPQSWLTRNFERTDKTYKVGNWDFNLYKKTITHPRKMIFGGNHQGILPVKKSANYVVFFVPEK